MKLSIIAACQIADNGIGSKGNLPWSIRTDLKKFKQITSTCNDPSKCNAVIMGRATWESLPKAPLPSRINIIISNTLKDIPCAFIFKSFAEAIEFVKHESELIENAFVIGGEGLFNEAIEYPGLHRVYLTLVNSEYECDRYFPPYDHLRCISQSQPLEENGITFTFAEYETI